MRALLCAIIGCLFFAAPAMAANQYTLSDAGSNVAVTAGDRPTVNIDYTATCIQTGVCNNALIVSSADEGTTFDNSSGCNDNGNGTAFTCGLTRLVVTGTAGADSVTGVCDSATNAPLTFSGGAGADEVTTPTCSGGIIDLGDGNDQALASGTISGGNGNDILRGGAGNDLLMGGPGADSMSGGTGIDTASFEDKTAAQPVTVTIDDQPNDGQSGGDNVRTDVENVIGGDGSDVLRGNAGNNVIQGGNGNDNIDPGAGIDVVDGGAGDDRITTRDGTPDVVTCGDGTDTAIVDAFDSLSGCEHVDSSRALMPDVDGDGVTAPTDCNDHNAKIRPGLRDKPGNGIDEDCSGKDAPFGRVLTSVQNIFIAGSTTSFSLLKLRGVPEKARAEVRCLGGRKKGCFSGVKKFRYPRGKDTANIRSAVRGRHFKPGATLEIRILATESIGKVARFVIRRNKAPKQPVLCIKPGKKKPQKHC